MKEFPDYKEYIDKRGREAYELLNGLTNLKRIFEYQGTIYELYKETRLNLSNNQIKILPPEIDKLSNLRILNLDNNQITTLPPEIDKLSNLQELYLYNNQITILPPEIGNLSQLQKLYLHNNQITMLPPEIGKLSNLQELRVDRKVIIPAGLKFLHFII